MSCLTEKAIGELLEYKFFIPSYQRGYRWTERQVEDLLEDIWDFIKKPKKEENEWYCLQPIVVKECDERNKRENDLQGTWYEVIDGQQRLTTIFLILKHLERFIESERKCFEIEFKTRNTELINSKEFLQEIDAKTVIESKTNIDYFHIFQAYEKIKDWFQEKANRGERSISSKFITPFLESTKVIWYEVASDKDAIEIFTRINMGKIPLTNAELIKALFLNSSNFPNAESEELRLRQLEIASEWDRIEYSLQNDELWYFINNSANKLPTRIEHIFNIMKDVEGVQKDNDQYSTFRFFSEKFKSHTKDEIDKNWKEIKRTFQTIEEWFLDRELYHKVGFLITAGEKITDLLNEAKKRQKNNFKELLNSKISEKVKCENLEDLEYGDWRIKNILLLHNIQIMLSNTNETSRFSFDRFKKENWDIEHIHAVATEMPKNKQHRIDWLKDSQKYINDDSGLKDKISEFVNSYDEKIKENPESFDELANSVLEYFSKKGNIETDINDISNLVLLDSGTNRSYKNAVFPVKREIVINKEKEGTFIPICTKNVFLKYYTQNPKQMTFWDENDRKAYLKDIEETISKFRKSE